jgi:hypothetical protein
MLEVMNACVIMHNMVIESELDTPADDDHPFDFQGYFAEIEQEQPSLLLSSRCMKKSEMQVFTLNYRMMLMRICGCGEETLHDSLQFILILVRII